MVYSFLSVRWGGRIGPAGYKSSFAAGREAQKEQQDGRVCSADLALFQRPRPWLPRNRMTKQTKFLIKPVFTDTYGEFGGLIASFDLSW